jgi:hypothetical protein
VKKYAVFIVIVILLSVSTAQSGRLYPESSYQEVWCQRVGGQQGYLLSDKTYIDCLTDDFAVDFDFADQWAVAIGRALYSANQTGRNPGIALIFEDSQSSKYLFRLLKAIEGSEKQWRVWVIAPDVVYTELENLPKIPSLMVPGY